MTENQGSGVQRNVQEALDTDLDAFLDRALSAQPAPELKPTLAAEKPAERLQSVLSLAAEEEQWLRKLPPPETLLESPQELESGPCEIPEHLRAKPAPEVSPALAAMQGQAETPWVSPHAPLPGLAMVPPQAQPGWNLPVAPAPVTRRRTRWLVAGALAGVSAASVLVTSMIWMTRDTLPEKAQAPGASVSTGTVTAVAPAPEPVLFVKDSPLARQPDPHLPSWIAAADGSVETLPGPFIPGRVTVSRLPPVPAPVASVEPKVEPAPPAPVAIPKLKVELPPAVVAQAPAPVVAKAEPLKPREPAQPVQAKKAQAVAEPPARYDIEDPTMEDSEEEIPLLQEPVAARAPEPVAVAKPAQPAAPKPSEYDDFDREFAQKLGFMDDAQKKPESNRVRSVWIPPAPGENLPQTLKPEDVQQVVAANQPAITSCIQRHKDALPGLSGGKFTMRWFIHPTGSTYQVAMETQALKGTAMATCIEGVVRGWKFPKHQTQMGPIRFPFIF